VNHFNIISAVIVVEEKQPDFDTPVTRRLLIPGENYTVPCYVLHRFRVVADGQVAEVYWPNPNKKRARVKQDDISRLDVGGYDGLEDLEEILTVRETDFNAK
jgi:hypothetical protein